MIYLDNAATGGFKQYAAKEVAVNVINNLCANPGRSGHKLSETASKIVFQARRQLCSFFNGYSTERTIFTKNCTEALNTAIFGTLKSGDHVITTCMEHNSVLRPLRFLSDTKGIKVSYVFSEKGLFSRKNDIISFDDLLPFLTNQTKLVIINGASNVNGASADINNVCQKLKKHFPKTFILVDAAQSGGHELLDLKQTGIDMLALACHKGLEAVGTLGALILSDRCDVSPLTYGGTGSDTFSPQPDYYPDRLESGTLNLPSIASLFESIIHLKKNLSFNADRLKSLTQEVLSKLNEIDEVTTFSLPNVFGIVAFSINGLSSIDAASILSDEYDIAVRGGFHCAPLMHKYLGTEEQGLIRASFAPQNTFDEADKLCAAVKELSSYSKKRYL